jgi:hypothetical protein
MQKFVSKGTSWRQYLKFGCDAENVFHRNDCAGGVIGTLPWANYRRKAFRHVPMVK